MRAETVIEGKYSVKIMEYTNGWTRISVWDLGDRLGSLTLPPSVLLWVIENVQSPQVSQPFDEAAYSAGESSMWADVVFAFDTVLGMDIGQQVSGPTSLCVPEGPHQEIGFAPCDYRTRRSLGTSERS
jgi:hypothetical protein